MSNDNSPSMAEIVEALRKTADSGYALLGTGCGVIANPNLLRLSAAMIEDQADRLAAVTAERDTAVKRQGVLDDALRDMVGQYCSYGGKLDHEFMSAGEHAFDVLDLDYGAPIETLWHGPQGAGEGGA